MAGSHRARKTQAGRHAHLPKIGDEGPDVVTLVGAQRQPGPVVVREDWSWPASLN